MRLEEPEKPQRLRDVIASVLAAAIGVQSEKNRQRDFASASPKRFIVVGIVATLVFIVSVYFVVRLVVGSAGV